MVELKRERIQVGSVQLSVLTAGPTEGKTVVLLHGFPERAESWINQINYLSSKGYFVIAPDQRGYEESDKPREVRDYNLNFLGDDIIGLINYYKKDSVYLIGHDWGAVVGWYLISFHEERFKKAILMSSPHWTIFQKNLLTNLKQFFKSWYIFFIQLPIIPELFIGANNYKNFASEIQKSSFNKYYPIKDLETLRLGWIKNKSMTSMLNWYRALRKLKTSKLSHKIKVPVSILWGKRDPFLLISMGEESLALCESAELISFENTGHWPQHENALELQHHIDKWSD